MGLQAGAGHLLVAERHILFRNLMGRTLIADKEGGCVKH